MKFFEVFKAGTYPQGVFSPDEVNALAQNYDPQFCEAPVTLDHEQKGPAYGWVSELKSENGKLKASFKDLSEELKEFVKSGKYKKISVEIYRNLEGKQPYLKAVSFLGASIPQVKGMSPIEFKEGEAETYIFENVNKIETPLKPQQNTVVGNEEIVSESEHTSSDDDAIVKLSQANETISKMQEQIAEMNLSIAKLQNNASACKEAETELQKLRGEITQNRFEQFLNQKVNNGHLTPIQKNLSLKILMSLENVKQFSEQDSQVDAFKELIETLPKQIEFQEIATKDNISDVDAEAEKFANADEESLEIFKEAKALAKKEGISFKDALLKIKL